MQMLQRIRATAKTSKHDHIKPLLTNLQWLPGEQRISFKTYLLAYKTLRAGQPQYLNSMLNHPKRFHNQIFRCTANCTMTENEVGKTMLFCWRQKYIKLFSSVCLIFQ